MHVCLYKLVDCKCEIPIKFITIIDLRCVRSIDRSSLLEVFPEIDKKCDYVTVQAQQTRPFDLEIVPRSISHISHTYRHHIQPRDSQFIGTRVVTVDQILALDATSFIDTSSLVIYIYIGEN